MSRVVLVVAAVLFALSADSGQEPQPSFRVGVDLVQVDVSVLDKDRKPVRGLTARDFTVLEDGKTRPIEAFVPVELAEPVEGPRKAAWVKEISKDVATNDVHPEGRLVVIMFDWSIRPLDQEAARRIARAAVDQLGPADLAAVVFTSGFGNAGTPQNFTADRARLLAAINRPIAAAFINPPYGPGHDPRNANGVMLDDPEGYEAGDCVCRVCVPEAIARVADAVRDVRGRRKTVLFIGSYFRLFESLSGPQSRQGPQFKPGLGGRAVVYPGQCSSQLKDAREKMERATAVANLTVHTLDPLGPENQENSPMGGSLPGMQERQEQLGALADLTGGRSVMQTSAPEALLPAVFAESHAFYLIGFTPADRQSKGRLHKIEVKVNRPGVMVRTRSGYFTGETVAPVSSASAALDGVLPRGDLPLTVSVAPFAMPGREEAAVAIALGVRQTAAAGGATSTGPIKVLAAAFDRNGRSVRSQEQTVEVSWRPNASGTAQYELVSHLALKPGRYEVRVAVEPASGGRGSVYTFVDVPDFAAQPMSLSGIVVAVTPGMPSAASDALTGLLPVVPTVRRAFARTDRATAFVRVYQAAKDPVQPATFTARIEDANGNVAWNDVVPLPAERFAAGHAADQQLLLPLDRLNPGEYLLTLEAAQGRNVARRGVRFTVR